MSPSHSPSRRQHRHLMLPLFSYVAAVFVDCCTKSLDHHYIAPNRNYLFISHLSSASARKPYGLYACNRRSRDKNKWPKSKGDGSSSSDDESSVDGVSEEELEEVFKAFRGKLNESEEFLRAKIGRIALHRATPSLLESVTVELPGEKTEKKLQHVASIMSKGNYELQVVPSSPSHLEAVFVSLSTKMVDYKVAMMPDRVSVCIPPMTEVMVRQARTIVKETTNEAKCQARTARQNTIKKLKKMQDRMSDDLFHRQQKEVDKLLKDSEKKIDNIANGALDNLK